MTIQEITLEKFLDENNPWTARLLGDETFQQDRNAAQIDREYDQDFYGRRLKEFESNPEEYRKSKLYSNRSDVIASVGDKIFKMPFESFIAIKRSTFLGMLARFSVSGELCELGAGNGQNHLWLKASQPLPVYGGEYSKNAVRLAGLLGLDIGLFNFYEPKDYQLIRPNTTVFTFHAIEQIPDATCIIAGLKSRRDQIDRVIHLEPLYRTGRKDLFGRLRNRYAEINDYNRNLLACLKADSEIEIEHLEEDAFGNNPLNPASVVVWRFR